MTITDQAATNPTPPFGPSIPPYTGPGPGNTVTVLVTFTGTKNKTYKITGSMNYKDSADKTQNVTATSVTVTVN